MPDRPLVRVPPDWPPSLPCPLAFIGEAPSDEEVAHRPPRPLVGPSGRVFNQILRTINVDRSAHLVTNVFDFQLPDNEVHSLCAPAREARQWPGYDLPPLDRGLFLRPEHAPQLERLAAELRRARPTVLVPLGATALWALSGLSNITATRGSVMKATRLAPGTKMVPTLHPAHVIHDWRLFHVVAADIEKAVRQSAFPEVRLPRRELWLAPSLADLAYFRHQWIDGAALLSCDIETGGGQITCIGFAPDPGRALVVPFVDFRRPSRSYWATADDELAALEFVREVCEGPVPKLFQNGPYDIMWLWDRYNIRVRNYREDTRLLHHALYPELPKSLGFMGATYALQGPWKLMNARNQGKRDE